MTLSVNRSEYRDSDLPEYLAQHYREHATTIIESICRPGGLLKYLSESDPFGTLSDAEIFFLWRSLGCPVGHAPGAGSHREMMMGALHDALEYASISDIVK